jgi:hypothetical protein
MATYSFIWIWLFIYYYYCSDFVTAIWDIATLRELVALPSACYTRHRALGKKLVGKALAKREMKKYEKNPKKIILIGGGAHWPVPARLHRSRKLQVASRGISRG